MSAPHLLVEQDGHVLILTMNRLDARNAMSLQMLALLADAWDRVEQDPEIRVAILTGAGGHFSAGADLKSMHNPPDDEFTARFKADPELQWRSFLRNFRPSKPIISAIEGTAVAGGTEIIEGTDIRIAGASARLGVAEAKWGLFPMGGSTVRLPRQIPYTLAMDMLLTARFITAEEALTYGLIGRVVPDGTALDEAKKVAAQIAENGPLAVQAIKRSVMEAEGLPEAEALAIELKHGWQVFGSEDAKEGPRAFAEKRKPNFQGR